MIYFMCVFVCLTILFTKQGVINLMNKPKWTEEQKMAILEKGENILVVAAARKRKNSGIS